MNNGLTIVSRTVLPYLLILLAGCTTVPTYVDYVPEQCKKNIPSQFKTYESYLATLNE